MSRVCCPKCQDKLVHSSNSVKCDCCQAVYPVYSGVIDFHGESDDFYEGKFGIGREKKSFLRKWIEPIYSRFSAAEIRNKHQKYFRKLHAQKGKAIEILDLGCGGGSPTLWNRKGIKVTGVDLSLSSLIEASHGYSNVYRSAVNPLPFQDNSFDVVCSFDLVGHILAEEKDKVISEIFRVLKPGGISFHYVEVDSPRGWNNWAKRRPDLYQKFFIEQDGHFGLEYYKTTLARFKNQRFELLEHALLAKAILCPSELSKRFLNGYIEESRILKSAVKINSFISKNLFARILLGIALKPIQMLVEPLVPDDFGGLLFVAIRKSK